MSVVGALSSEMYVGAVRSLSSEMYAGVVGSLSSEMWMSFGLAARSCM